MNRKKAILIYNPKSGQAYFKQYLDEVIDCIQYDYDNDKEGYAVEVVRISKWGDIQNFFDNIDYTPDVIIGSGGDGTINTIVAHCVDKFPKVPVCIIPSGTANDFAVHLGLPNDPVEIVKIMHKNNVQSIDIGRIDDKAFINVVAVGNFANISNEIDQDIKNRIGKLAYYIKGAEKLKKLKQYKLRISTDKQVYEDDYFLVLVINSRGAGGFKNISPKSSIQDGKLDIIGIRKPHMFDVPKILIELANGTHINNENFLYVSSESIKIENLMDEDVYCDVDGDIGPILPVNIKCDTMKLKTFVVE